MTRTLALALVLLSAPTARADGGAVVLRDRAGPFIVSVLATPAPLRVGPAALAVIVERHPTGELVRNAGVRLFLDGKERAPGANLALPAAGTLALVVRVTDGADAAELSASLAVAPRRARLAGIWPELLLPPLVVSLFAFYQLLTRRNGSARRR